MPEGARNFPAGSSRLSECDKEPIHIPGSIQPHGLFFALDANDLSVQQVSANIETVYGVPVKEVLGQPMRNLVDDAQRQRLKEIIEKLEGKFTNPLRVPLHLAGQSAVFDGITHRSGDTIILELENPNEAEVSDAPGSRSVDAYFQLVSRSLSLVAECGSIVEVSDLMAREVRGFTGFDRVMVYRFAPDFHGEVIAEARRDDLEPFLGLHYPATDIPQQARELYKKNWIRLLRHVDDVPVPIVPALNPQTGGAIDLSFSVLRSVSPIHIQYLKNMGVAATMTVSLLAGDELWGLIACHHYSGPKFVPYAERSACVLYGVVMSAQIVSKDRRFRAEAESATRSNLNAWLQSLSGMKSFESVSERLDVLMNMVEAEGAASVRGDQISVEGRAPASKQEIRDLAEFGQTRLDHGVWITDSLGIDYPQFKHLSSTSAGFIMVEVSEDWFLLFFRGEQTQVVRWGGDPHKRVDPDSPLTPRHSFAEWKETVKGRSLPWRDAIRVVIAELRASLVFFVVERNRELERVNRQLEARSAEVEQLVYTVSHDLKSPLVTCSGYLEILKEELADGNEESITDAIERIERATVKMGNLIQDLLAFSRVGKHEQPPRLVSVDGVIERLKQNLEPRLDERRATLMVDADLGYVLGYERDIVRVFENLLDNALKYGCGNARPLIEIGARAGKKSNHLYVRDNGDGIEARYHDVIFQLFKRATTVEQGTGVGLASVAKIVTQHGGSVRVESSPGHGACFRITLPKPERSNRKNRPA